MVGRVRVEQGDGSGLVTAARAAAILDVEEAEVRAWAKRGLVHGQRVRGRGVLYRVDELERAREQLEGGEGGNYRVFKSRKVPFTHIELFTGAGGMALGLENAGLRSRLLVEKDRDCVATLRRNWPKKEIYEGDVADCVLGEHAGEVDLLAGGFPCQAFSYAGSGRGFGDTRGTLFFEFARLVGELRPKVVLGENVRGLERHDGGRTLATMVSELRGLGYRVAAKVLRAQFLGVPQKRERLILLGVRGELDLPLLFPAEVGATISVREALRGVPDSPGFEYPEGKRGVMELVPEGGNWRHLPEDVARAYLGASYHSGGGRTGMARRLAWDEPSLTLTCHPGQKQTERCHPEQTRPLTTREYARLQTFPDGWKFEGGVRSVYRQIGNALPVNLGYHLGRCVVAMLDGRARTEDMVELAEPAALAEQMRLAF